MHEGFLCLIKNQKFQLPIMTYQDHAQYFQCMSMPMMLAHTQRAMGGMQPQGVCNAE